MVILDQEDLYQVKLASLIADYDRQTLVDLYMPIVGYTAISIYFKLWCEAEKDAISMFKRHYDLFVAMQISTGKFIEERKKLEALGLLKTNIKKEHDIQFYTYQVYAPKTPEKFFSNSLLYGTLIKYLGNAGANKLKQSYHLEESIDYGRDISASFGSIYSPNLNDPVYKKALEVKKGEIIDRLQSKVDAEFNYKRFIEYVMASSQISEAVFTKKVLKEIERLTALYGIGEKAAAQCFIDCYNPNANKENRIDFKKMTEMFQDEIKYPFLTKDNVPYEDPGKIQSDTNLARKINMMEDVSCKEYLQIKQNNTIPVIADLKLVDDLSSKLGLRPAVINAIIDYALAKNNNVLSRAYVEKVAASVAREKIKTAYDTMVFLNKKKIRKTKTYTTKPLEEVENIDKKVAVKAESNNDDDDFDEEAWQKMIEGVGGK